MTPEVRCGNLNCGRVSRFGFDPLGRAFRCPACGAKLPRSYREVVEERTFGRPPSAPWAREKASPGRSLGSALPANIGKYRVLGALAQGNVGTAYRAFDPEFAREVALRFRPRRWASEGAESLARFVSEARGLSALNHPAIVPVIDASSEGSQPYIVTPLIEGRTLAVVLDDGPLAPALAAEIAETLASALAYAHELGFMHRDVKPSNVLVGRIGDVYLTEFGPSRRLGAGGDAGEEDFGDGPACLAPELIQKARSPDLRKCDQHALGVLLYQMLCGRPPFIGAPRVVLYAACNDDPLPPSAFAPGVPAGLERVCMKAIARRPEARYEDCRSLAVALRGWRARLLEKGEGRGAVRRAGRWVRRRPLRSVTAALAALALAASTAYASSWLALAADGPLPILRLAHVLARP